MSPILEGLVVVTNIILLMIYVQSRFQTKTINEHRETLKNLEKNMIKFNKEFEKVQSEISNFSDIPDAISSLKFNVANIQLHVFSIKDHIQKSLGS